MNEQKRVVVIGGGTGTYTVLTGLKRYDVDLAAVVAMSDNGGSTGILRSELDVLPPGDVRQCLVALSSSDVLMRSLMSYRFERGALKGHSFGNLLLSALEKITGNFGSAVEKASEVLRTEGRVIPVTLDPVDLMAKVGGVLVKGEEAIQNTSFADSLEHLWLEPVARANPRALRVLREADVIVLGPGNLYASIVPTLLVRGIARAVCASKAQKVFVCNLVTKAEHMPAYSVADCTHALERYLGGRVDAVLYNDHMPGRAWLKRSMRPGDELVSWRQLPEGRLLQGGDFFARRSRALGKIGTAAVESSLVRHDATAIAAAIAGACDIRRKR